MILGAGRAMGERIVRNDELPDPAWPLEKAGITRRHHRNGVPLSELSLRAARYALDTSGLVPDDIDIVVVATCSHEYVFPSAAAKLHSDLGMKGGQIFDVQANCAGFVTALACAADRLAADPQLRHALVVGAEALSDYADMSDTESATFFSDGAGAVVIGRGPYTATFYADTSNYESVRCRRNGLMEMQGLATWKQAVSHLPSVMRSASLRGGWERPDLVILHQANLHLIRFLLGRLGWQDIGFTNVETVGNAGAASIPVAIADAYNLGKLHGRVMLAGVGAGFGFGAITLEVP